MVAGMNLRTIVDPPVYTPSPYGLLAAADLRSVTDHELAGVTWRDQCGGAGTTVDYCISSAPVITGSGSVVAKSANSPFSHWGATPFTVYVETDCSPVDYYDNRDAIIRRALDKYESYWVEHAFWTGYANDNSTGGTPMANAVLPHLASNGAITEQDFGVTITLQQSATVVTGAALNVLDALGVLEGALAKCLNGTGTIHVPQALAPSLALILQRRGNQFITPNGNVAVIGSGYPGTAPAGTNPALGTCWMYATGPVFGYRSDARIVGDPTQTIDRSTNTMKVIIERTYVLGYGCCLLAQLVNTSSFFASSSSGP